MWNNFIAPSTSLFNMAYLGSVLLMGDGQFVTKGTERGLKPATTCSIQGLCLTLQLHHLKNFAVDGDGLEKRILASVAGRGDREAVRAANLQVVLDAEAQPAKRVGIDSFHLPR